MNVIGWSDFLGGSLPQDRPAWLTVGVFDGLHAGHRNLLAEVTGGPAGTQSVVLTFSGSPVLVHSPNAFPGSILTLRQKLERMATLGVETAVVIDFSDEMSNLSGEEFVRLLRQNLTIQRIVVGQNFRFGKRRISGADDLREMLSGTGIEVLVTAPVMRGTSTVSSSRIRASVRAGELAEAQAMLSAAHAVDVRYLQGGRADESRVRFSRSDIGQVLPPVGTYAITCESDGTRFAGTCSIDDEALTVDDGTQLVVFDRTEERRKE